LELAAQILRGLRTFHSPTRLASFGFFTVLIWSVDCITAMLGAYALGLQLPFRVALLLITGMGLGSALPSTPGYVGIYQFVTVSVLVPFGFTKTNAVAYILLAQAVQYVYITFWGLFAISRSRGITFKAAAQTVEQ